ncbi:MAG TPA: carboxypeptidase regulatory-like domain-containing protein [Planctomycetota bacterium]|nr:carboxypeptidase regulatory-like domain-containing protein [Planctomycetota bacterium]
MKRILVPSAGLLAGLMLVLFSGCSGSDGAAGRSTGSFTGTVVNTADGNAAVAGAEITTDPAVTAPVHTNAEGVYVIELPAGTYTLTCTAEKFEACSEQISVLAGVTQTADMAMVPTSKVVIEIQGAPASVAPGEEIALTAVVTPMDGSTVLSLQWRQVSAAPATFSAATAPSTTVTLADAFAYKQQLVDRLHVQDRFTVLGIDPYAEEGASLTTLQCVVTTTSGTYEGKVDLHAELPFATWSTGIRNVPLQLPVLIGGRIQASYDWSLTAPSMSHTELVDADSRFPWFVPDVPGAYLLTVTDRAGPVVSAFSMTIYAAEWNGGIIGIDAQGRPETICATSCHTTYENQYFTKWVNTGHAEIFTDNLNSGGHYGKDCFACHTVGYNPAADNGGFDDSQHFGDFMAAVFPNGASHPSPDNWSNVVANWPKQAKLANIQCENCHGPGGDGGAHRNPSVVGSPRFSVSAAVCGSCHGEPKRHARYQQWQESGHGNFETALAEGTNDSCAKCHSAQGFLQWVGNGLDPAFNAVAPPAGEVEPITCVVCHDPHDVGTVSGDSNNVKMRVEGDSPPLMAGFTAYGLGHGATCIVCHNSRRGSAESAINSTPDRAPHGGTQGDVLMGENLFFVTAGGRGPHSLISNTCTKCHMALTPPPAEFSYELSGTNHTFMASTSICAECHGQFDANALQALTHDRVDALAAQIGSSIAKEIAFHTAAGRAVRITGTVNGSSATTDVTAASVLGPITILDSHGRAAMNLTIDNVLYEGVQINGNTQILVEGTAHGRLLANDYSAAEQILARALWNYFMLHNDSSWGVHNPGKVTEVLAATAAQLTANWP